jgi:hypothetical protein
MLGPIWSITRTPDEISIVTSEEHADPTWANVEHGWRCFKVRGPLDFSLVGILAALAGTLAAANISVFAISTYDTDYILVRDGDADRAATALMEAGHAVSVAEKHW